MLLRRVRLGGPGGMMSAALGGIVVPCLRWSTAGFDARKLLLLLAILIPRKQAKPISRRKREARHADDPKSTPLSGYALVLRCCGPPGQPKFGCPRGAAGNDHHSPREEPYHLHCA